MLRARQKIRIRQLETGETATIDAVFAGLSPTSRRHRFHGPVDTLSERSRALLADVDGADHVALVAEERHVGRWTPIGIARFVRVSEAAAEASIAVVDAAQRRGVARRLLTELAQVAAAAGLERLIGQIEPGNDAALGLLRSVLPDARCVRSRHVVAFTVEIRDRDVLTIDDVMADLREHALASV